MHRMTHMNNNRGHRGPLRRGISLTEVLLSMGVMVIGLLSVAAVFPVGGSYMAAGDQFDSAAMVGQAAFSDLVTRGWLNPLNWRDGSGQVPNPPGTGFLDYSAMPQRRPTAFVIDPLGAAAFTEAFVDSGIGNANAVLTFPAGGDLTWPVRRITFANLILNSNGTFSVHPSRPWMPSAVAQVLSHSRDDLAIEIPEGGDQPPVQQWEQWNRGGVPQSLARNWKGDYSWLATISPTTVDAAHSLVAPAGNTVANIPPNSYSQHSFDVSVAVFRKRDLSDATASERLVRCRVISFGSGGGAVQFEQLPGQPLGRALERLRPGHWVPIITSSTNNPALIGTPPPAGSLAHGIHAGTGTRLGDLPRVIWYRLLDIDNIARDGVHLANENQFDNTAPFVNATLAGPDWPQFRPDETRVLPAAIVPGVVAVYTRTQRLEAPTLWSQ